MQSLCVFCGSSKGVDPAFVEAARWLGKTLAEKKIKLVFGGGKIGLMGELARSCLNHGGEVVGIIPRFLAKKEIAYEGISELIDVDSMHERKLKMSQLADGFMALPGGYGTLEEFCEILTWVQLSLISKPIGIWNVKGFFNPLITQFDQMVASGFLKQSNLKFFAESGNGSELLIKMEELSAAVDSFEDKFIHD